MRVLVTGANGFIGAHLVQELEAKHEVIALARSAPTFAPSPSTRWIEHDLVEPLEAAELPDAVDAVIHLAQSRHYKQFPERADDIFAVNIDAPFHLLEYARLAKAKAFIFASTGGVYGYSYERFAETDPVSPLDFYLSSKYATELLIANYRRFFCTIVLRFFFVYGPGQRGMLIPNLLDKVRNGEIVTIEGRGLRINPIHVADAVKVFEPSLALERSDLFNVCGDEAVDLDALVRLMGEAAGKPASIEHIPGERDGDILGDNARMKSVLGVRPRITLADGIASMLES
jgi:nucleoside-diphosphate-sugar epimerase